MVHVTVVQGTVDERESALTILRGVEANLACADCGATRPKPDWASINIGIVLCIQVASRSVHHSFGLRVCVCHSAQGSIATLVYTSQRCVWCDAVCNDVLAPALPSYRSDR